MYYLFARWPRTGQLDRIRISGGHILTLIRFAERLGLFVWVIKIELVNGAEVVRASYHVDADTGRLIRFNDYEGASYLLQQELK